VQLRRSYLVALICAVLVGVGALVVQQVHAADVRAQRAHQARVATQEAAERRAGIARVSALLAKVNLPSSFVEVDPAVDQHCQAEGGGRCFHTTLEPHASATLVLAALKPLPFAINSKGIGCVGPKVKIYGEWSPCAFYGLSADFEVFVHAQPIEPAHGKATALTITQTRVSLSAIDLSGIREALKNPAN
jgi:hypothetical protein